MARRHLQARGEVCSLAQKAPDRQDSQGEVMERGGTPREEECEMPWMDTAANPTDEASYQAARADERLWRWARELQLSRRRLLQLLTMGASSALLQRGGASTTGTARCPCGAIGFTPAHSFLDKRSLPPLDPWCRSGSSKLP